MDFKRALIKHKKLKTKHIKLDKIATSTTSKIKQKKTIFKSVKFEKKTAKAKILFLTFSTNFIFPKKISESNQK